MNSFVCPQDWITPRKEVQEMLMMQILVLRNSSFPTKRKEHFLKQALLFTDLVRPTPLLEEGILDLLPLPNFKTLPDPRSV